MAYIPYTAQEDDIIRKLHGKGLRPVDITKVLISRSANQIKDRGYALGLKWSAKPEIDMTAFKRLMEAK